jgi:hypothetical protein
MTTEERARALAGDMPWITSELLHPKYADFVEQVRAYLDAAVMEETERLLHMLSAARDFIVEGGSITLIGAREFIDQIDEELERLPKHVCDCCGKNPCGCMQSTDDFITSMPGVRNCATMNKKLKHLYDEEWKEWDRQIIKDAPLLEKMVEEDAAKGVYPMFDEQGNFLEHLPNTDGEVRETP